uniref:Uncharacterized protein n=1 Tax=viral metagenome TaxID=1070528 RepID=A0A6C0EXI5_9ZZZZ
MILDDYDDFNFMVVIMFLFFMLILFISMIVINVNYRAKLNPRVTSSQNAQTTLPQCTLKNSYDQC